MKKIGIMGCGIVAKFGHIPAIIETDTCELGAIFDPNELKLKQIQEKFDFPAEKCFTDVMEFFEKGDFEAVSITSPAPTHKENCLLAARYGKPVICEKPLAMNEEDARIMIDTMNKAKLQLWVGLVCRFSPVAQKIRQLIKDKAIGDIRSLRLIFNWACHGKYRVDDDTGEYGLNRRREGRMFEGGPMVDCGTHQIDLARWWLGSEIVRYDGFGAWVEDYEAPDHSWLHLDHENGAHTMIEISFSYCHTASEQRNEFIYELIGTDGVIRYDRNEKTIVIHGKEESLRVPSDEDRGFGPMYEDFAQALDSGESEYLATGEEGLIATRISRLSTDEAIHKRDLMHNTAGQGQTSA